MNPSQDPQSSNDATNLSIRSGAKILVSGLPPDVTEELFEQTVSNVRRVELAFNQSGVSKGMALIEFISSDSGLDAHQQFHGKIIDGASILNVELVSIPIVETMKFTPLHPLNVSNVNHTQPNQAQSTSAQNKKFFLLLSVEDFMSN
ncbi:hypothetical protein PPACK8108_LOCUS8625 [Phakopsora pachyrhizi]|uniref:RRM domain-containing protein n=1 Tax=Phakopsora pachyrhizi TaxID=170000 RepID=A0AAV0AVL0_PHAPC|nr:hypothetical protein PPACK8108_LOCUS8625 [Phakopsora pachyrhizi]